MLHTARKRIAREHEQAAKPHHLADFAGIDEPRAALLEALVLFFLCLG